MTSNHNTENKLFTAEEVAAKLERSIHTISRWQREGHVKPEYKYNNGRLTRYFSQEDIEILEQVRDEKFQIMISGTGGGIEENDSSE